MNPACFAAVPNLPAGTVLSNFNPQQTNGTGSYLVGNNGVAGDSGVGSLFGGLGRNILRGPGAERFDLALSKIFPVRKLGEAGKRRIPRRSVQGFEQSDFLESGRLTSATRLSGPSLQPWIAQGEFCNWL